MPPESDHLNRATDPRFARLFALRTQGYQPRMFAPSDLDVLVPTKDRPGALGVTPAGLAARTMAGFHVVISECRDYVFEPAWAR